MFISNLTGFHEEAIIVYDPGASKALGKDYWRVLNDFSFIVEELEGYVYIPRGYLSDGASVPRIFWNVIPPWGRYGQAVIVHDYLCENLMMEGYGGVKVEVTRKQADDILDTAMKELAVNSITRKLIMLGVSTYRRLFKPTKPVISPLKIELQESFDITEWNGLKEAVKDIVESYNKP